MSNPGIQGSSPKIIAPITPKKVEKTIPQAPPLPQTSVKTTSPPRKRQTENLALSNPEIDKSIEESSPKDIQNKQKVLSSAVLDIEKKLNEKRQNLIKNSFNLS